MPPGQQEQRRDGRDTHDADRGSVRDQHADDGKSCDTEQRSERCSCIESQIRSKLCRKAYAEGEEDENGYEWKTPGESRANRVANHGRAPKHKGRDDEDRGADEERDWNEAISCRRGLVPSAQGQSAPRDHRLTIYEKETSLARQPSSRN